MNNVPATSISFVRGAVMSPVSQDKSVTVRGANRGLLRTRCNHLVAMRNRDNPGSGVI